MNHEIEPLVGEAELRRIFPMSKRTLARRVKEGCPSRKIEGRRMYRPSAVEKWLQRYNQGNWS